MHQRSVALMVGKKIKGRKRHIVVDIFGHLLSVDVHAANEHDTKSCKPVLRQAKADYPSIEGFSADAGYRKTALEFVQNEMNLKMHISEKIKDTFAILPKRWIVERTFAWLGNFRRLSKDYEILSSSAQNIIRIAMIKVTLAKLC